MAWTAVNPTTVGNATKETHYDTVWDNGDFLYAWVNARSIFIFEAAAPTGWTIIAGCSDSLLAVKGGAGSYNVAGGTKLAAGSTWTQPNHTHTDGAHTHATASHALTEAEMPSHHHHFSPSVVSAGGGSYAGVGAATAFGTNNVTSGPSGTNGTAHSHGNTGSAGDGGQTGNGATANTWRPLANIGILIAKT